MAAYFYSTWYKNGDDILFYEPEFQELAESILNGEHAFKREYSTLGWHNIYTTKVYKLEIIYDPFGKGYGQIWEL